MKTTFGKLGTGLCLTALAAFLLPTISTQASIVRNGDITAIFGSGNSDNDWSVATTGNLEIGLRAKVSGAGVTPSDGNGNYTLSVSPWTSSSSKYTYWNYEFSVNVDKNGAASTTLATSGYSYWVAIDGYSLIDLSLIPDNQYGVITTANGKGTKGSYSAESSSFYIMQNSEPIAGVYTDGSKLPLDASSGHTFSLLVKDSTGSLVLSDTITVNGGYPVPEPTTILAGALMLLPLGVGAIRTLRRN